MYDFKHELGLLAESKVSAFKGIITSRSQNLYGCNRYYIQSKMNKDMKVEGWWVDEDDIIIKGKGVTAKSKDTGGPMSKIN